jgi:site-specific DNA-adenine methylase
MCELLHVTAGSIVVADAHRQIINLAKTVQDRELGPKLIRRLRRYAFHPETLKDAQDWLQDHPDPTEAPDLEYAERYFIAVWMGRSAKAGTADELKGKLPVRWNGSGGDSNVRYRSAVRALRQWHEIMRRCNFLRMDCFDFLARANDADRHGIYCDPPFPDAGDAYAHAFAEEDHRRLATCLSAFRKAKVVCRFYEHPLISELYPEPAWTWQRQKGRKQSNAEGAEILITNGKD